MTTQAIQLPASSVKTGGMWCALSMGHGSTIRGLRYLGSSKETVITSSQASVFTARNPRNPEADQHQAALD